MGSMTLRTTSGLPRLTGLPSIRERWVSFSQHVQSWGKGRRQRWDLVNGFLELVRDWTWDAGVFWPLYGLGQEIFSGK